VGALTFTAGFATGGIISTAVILAGFLLASRKPKPDRHVLGVAVHDAAAGEPVAVRLQNIPASDEVEAERDRRAGRQRRGPTPEEWLPPWQ
jgi:hypothetical protein